MKPDIGSGACLRKGVTIVELLTVVIIIGILSAVAVPRLLTSTSLTSLDGDYIRLGQAIERGRKAAMKSGARHYLTIDTTKGKWTLYKEKEADSVLSTTADSVVFADSLSKTIRFGFSFIAPSKIATTKYVSPTTGFTDVNPSSTGLGGGFASESCIDATAAGQAGWAIITFCGGVTSSMESGAAYLSSKRSDKIVKAILYNPNVDLHLLRFSWNGTSWGID